VLAKTLAALLACSLLGLGQAMKAFGAPQRRVRETLGLVWVPDPLGEHAGQTGSVPCRDSRVRVVARVGARAS